MTTFVDLGGQPGAGAHFGRFSTREAAQAVADAQRFPNYWRPIAYRRGGVQDGWMLMHRSGGWRTAAPRWCRNCGVKPAQDGPWCFACARAARRQRRTPEQVAADRERDRQRHATSKRVADQRARPGPRPAQLDLLGAVAW